MIDNHFNVLRNRKLSLEGAQLIGTGATCKVYDLQDGNVVKVLFSTDYKEAEREILLSKWAFLKGLPTAISYDVVEVDGHPGLLYESLGRDNLRNHFRDEADNLMPLLKQYLEFIKTINSIDIAEWNLPSAKQKTLSEIQEIQTIFTANEYNDILKLIDSIPEDTHMVHGDCHIKNIKMRDGKLLLIDLDTLSAGNPIFELSGLCCGYHAYSALNIGDNGYNDFFEINQNIIETIYSYIMGHYFENISLEEKRSNQEKIELLTYIHMLHDLNPDNPSEKPLYTHMFDNVRKMLPTISDLLLKS